MVVPVPHLPSPVRPETWSLSLQRTDAGWALFDAREREVFAADGAGARQRCLAYASAEGVLHLTFDEQLHAV